MKKDPQRVSKFDNSIITQNGGLRMSGWNSARKKKIKDELMSHSGSYTCSMCFKTSDDSDFVHLDHILPKSLGGSNKIDNFDLLCKSCNSSKGKFIGLERPRMILRDMENELDRIKCAQLDYELKHGHINEESLKEFELEIERKIDGIKERFLNEIRKVGRSARIEK